MYLFLYSLMKYWFAFQLKTSSPVVRESVPEAETARYYEQKAWLKKTVFLLIKQKSRKTQFFHIQMWKRL